MVPSKTKSEIATKIWFRAKPNPRLRLSFDLKQNKIRDKVQEHKFKFIICTNIVKVNDPCGTNIEHKLV